MIISSGNNERIGGENNAESRFSLFIFSLDGGGVQDKQIDYMNTFLCGYQKEMALSATVNNT